MQRIAFPYYPSNTAARMAGHHGFGQRKAAGTAGLAQALAPSVAGIGAAGYGHAIELQPASGGKNQHREDDVGVDGGRADQGLCQLLPDGGQGMVLALDGPRRIAVNAAGAAEGGPPLGQLAVEWIVTAANHGGSNKIG